MDETDPYSVVVVHKGIFEAFLRRNHMNMLVMEEEQRELDDRLKYIPLCKFNFHIKKAQRHAKFLSI